MNRREYIAELNRLAAIHVMKWELGPQDIMWFQDGQGIRRVSVWNPCEVKDDTHTLIKKALAWKDFDGVCRWRFDLRYEFGHWTAAFYQGDDVPLISTERWYYFGHRDPECGVAVAKNAIETGGGELPSYIKKGQGNDDSNAN